MIFYIGLFLVYLILSLIEMKTKNKIYLINGKRVNFELIIGIIAFSIIAFLIVVRKKTVGGDLPNYESKFLHWRSDNVDDILTIKNSNVGFALIFWIISKFTSNFYWAMRIVGLISFGLFFYSFKKYTKNISFTLLIFIAIGGIPWLFSCLRQTLAMSVLLLSATKLYERKYLWYFIWLIVASCIHFTAIIGIFYLLFVFTKSKNWMRIKIFVLAALCAIAALLFMQVLVKIYTINDYSEVIVSGQGWKQLILFIVLLFAILFFRRKEEYSIKDINTYSVNAFAVGTTMQILTLGFSILAKLVEYFTMFLPIVISNMFMGDSVKFEKKTRYWLLAITILGFFAFYIYNTHNDLSKIIPYNTIWQ